jgi:hypothetical protein
MINAIYGQRCPGTGKGSLLRAPVAIHRGAPGAPHHIPKFQQGVNVKHRLFTLWNYTVMYTQSFFKGFFMTYLAVMPIAMWFGSTVIVGNYLTSFVGEDRAAAFVAKHPVLIGCLALFYMVATCGMGYWAWTTSLSKIEADFEARNRNHSKLFKAA